MRDISSTSKKYRWGFAICSAVLALVFAYIFYFVDPSTQYFGIEFIPVVTLLIVISLFAFCITQIFVKNYLAGVLISAFIAFNYALRLFGFKDILYFLILLILFLLIWMLVGRGEGRKE